MFLNCASSINHGWPKFSNNVTQWFWYINLKNEKGKILMYSNPGPKPFLLFRRKFELNKNINMSNCWHENTIVC